MIQLQLTAAGLAAVTRNSTITFTRFIAGSGTSDQESIAAACQDVPITNSQIFVAGQTYTINGQQTTVDYNAVEVTGLLSASQADEAYQWTELALMAREGAGEEFTFAYGCVVNNAFYIDPSESVSYVIPFSIIFSDAPDVTVHTTDSGVPWTTFLNHESADISTGAHGLSVVGGDLALHGQSLGLALREDVDARTHSVSGVDVIVNELPTNVMSYVGMLAYVRSTQLCYRCAYTEPISVGDYIRQVDSLWQKCSQADENAILVIDDESTPAEGELTWSEAQAHFCAWSAERSLNERLKSLEEGNSRALTFKNTDTREYDSEWVSRMTGAGTEASPYLIYTPHDFNSMRNNTTASYRLMANIDMSAAIGIPVSVVSGELIYGDVNSEAPLYNGGQGWIPIASFRGNLYGNGKCVRGIVCDSAEMEVGIFGRLTGATVSDLTVADSYFINRRTANDPLCAAIAGRAELNSHITRCISSATVLSEAANVPKCLLGGIVAYADTSTVTACANYGHVSAKSTTDVSNGGMCGYATKSTFTQCYNRSDLSGVYVGGMAGVANYNSSARSTFSRCYNSGLITATQRSASIADPASNSTIDTCYCLSGCATTMQGTALSDSELRSTVVVDALNDGAQNAVFVAGRNSYPVFDFETVPELSTNLALTVIDQTTKQIMNSGYTLGDLLHQPSRWTFDELRSSIAAKSKVQRAAVTLAAADWANSEQTVQASGASSSSTVVLIPKSADAFTYALAVSGQGTDEVTVTCTGSPAADIDVDLLIID